MSRKPSKALDLGLGVWRMRNGHTVEITKSKRLVYEDPRREIILWTGWCEECGFAISWIGFAGGRYATRGFHDYDIVERVRATKTEQKAA